MTRSRGLVLMVAATLVWGATFTVVKTALADAGPLTFLALRFALAAAVVLPALRRAGAAAFRSPWVLLCGAALFAGYGFQTAGLAATTPARSAFVTSLSVILVPLLEPLAGLGRPGRRAWAGALLALAGLAVLLRPDGGAVGAGDALTLGCAVAFAVHLLLLQRAVRQTPAAAVNAVQVAVVAVLAVPAAAVEGWRVTPTARLGVALAVTAVLATVLAFRAMAEAQRVVSAAQTAVVLAFEPVAAGIISVALGQDAVTLPLVAGGVLVVAGVIVATARADLGVGAGQAEPA